MGRQSSQKEYPFFNATWSRLMNDFILSGGLRDMNEGVIKTWLIVRAHTNLYSGLSFPSADEIAKIAGHCEKTSRRALKDLRERELPLLKATPRGRGYEYTIVDYLRVETEPGKYELIEFDYIPSLMEKMIKKLSQELGAHRSGNIINIGDININIDVHKGDINIQMSPDTNVWSEGQIADTSGGDSS
ncbi:hypothetical protein [Varunaivibrio sulfuroxidans]|uniref:Helix-turn-helix protein n=1 Tax=Varunaivibrio sulfuroxidans TaxID=1773489 RepID=A0A4R3J8A7_9PROT|nr:hypothetical protein [Varunaivibrio sulfuroxidans]TCS61595.1 hypothetical protein EDD55_1071 [Varunaivibrio sulfuroxidans]WES29530.1 hypothetical protein P3M64_07615 [Varunaivibrio sulfuroxidans]